MYLCSCLFLARSPRLAVVALLLLCMTFPVLWWFARGIVKAGDLSLASQLLYSFLPAALLPYSIGTVMWFKRDRLKLMTPGWLVAGLVGTLACTIFVYPRAVTLAYILVLPCLVAIIGALMFWPRSAKLGIIDTFFWSYVISPLPPALGVRICPRVGASRGLGLDSYRGESLCLQPRGLHVCDGACSNRVRLGCMANRKAFGEKTPCLA